MSIKGTLFTAITAGIIFLSGMAILGKNAFIKKERFKKSYLPIQETKAPVEIKEEFFEKPVDEVAVSTPLESMEKQLPDDEKVLLQMLSEVIKNRGVDKGSYTHRYVITPRRVGQVALTAKTGRSLTFQPHKLAHNIREPSISKLSYSVKEPLSDKGG